MPKRSLKINDCFPFLLRRRKLKDCLKFLILRLLSSQKQFSQLKNSQKLRRQNKFRRKNLKKLDLPAIKTLRRKKEEVVKSKIGIRSNNRSQAYHPSKTRQSQHQRQNLRLLVYHKFLKRARQKRFIRSRFTINQT